MKLTFAACRGDILRQYPLLPKEGWEVRDMGKRRPLTAGEVRAYAEAARAMRKLRQAQERAERALSRRGCVHAK
jgi:hypothetical protein